MKWVLWIFLTGMFFGLTPIVRAADLYDVSINAQDIVFEPDQPILNQLNQLYVTLRNNGERNVEGTVVFYVDNERVGSKAFSLRVNGHPEEVWVNWMPRVLGPHTVRVQVINDPEYPDANIENNTATESTYVDLDTDGDGVPDRLDLDRDNDGLSNEQEANLRTNPIKRDSDNDGVADKEDFYPLDSTRTRYTPPASTPPTTRTAPATNTAPRQTSSVPRPGASVSGSVTATSNPSLSASLGGAEQGIPAGSASSGLPFLMLATSTPLVTDETASSSDVGGSVQGMDGSDTSIEQQATSTAATDSSYRLLWLIAAVTTILALGFVLLDWRERRRL